MVAAVAGDGRRRLGIGGGVGGRETVGLVVEAKIGVLGVSRWLCIVGTGVVGGEYVGNGSGLVVVVIG